MRRSTMETACSMCGGLLNGARARIVRQRCREPYPNAMAARGMEATTPSPKPERLAESARNDAPEQAVHLHNLTVAYRTQGVATFPKGSSNWVLFDSLPVTTPRRKHQAGDEGEGDGEPEAPTS